MDLLQKHETDIKQDEGRMIKGSVCTEANNNGHNNGHSHSDSCNTLSKCLNIKIKLGYDSALQ